MATTLSCVTLELERLHDHLLDRLNTQQQEIEQYREWLERSDEELAQLKKQYIHRQLEKDTLLQEREVLQRKLEREHEKLAVAQAEHEKARAQWELDEKYYNDEIDHLQGVYQELKEKYES